MRYLPHTEAEIRDMLSVAGLSDIDELFQTIPEEARFSGDLDVPPAMGEARLMRHMIELSEKNTSAKMLSFLGGGAYAHHIPPAVDQLLLRSEFYTAYTPYQPEVAQGTLQAIWEFQTLVSELYGLPLANASLYDGASATAEAVLMARRLTRRDGAILSACVHPQYRETTQAYLDGSAPEAISTVAMNEHGSADVENLIARITDQTACVVIGYPSFVGTVAELGSLAAACHERGALLVATVVEPFALGLCAPPGQWGADIVVGEGQPLACPPQYGGPGVGLFACRNERKYLQQLPGRVCGETVDTTGKRGFVLTLSTREQHIRRERATSNICTNQGLLALAFTIRLSLLGRSGFVETAKQCLAKAHYLKGRLLSIPGISDAYPNSKFFNEFSIILDGSGSSKLGSSAADVLSRLQEQSILGGLDVRCLGSNATNQILIAVTEQHTREDMDRLVQAYASL